MAISENHRRFIAELVARPKRNQTEAYLHVFGQTLDRDIAARKASDLMKKPEIAAAVAMAEEVHLRKIEITAEEVLRDIKDIKDTPINELVAWHVGACRYCHGDGHLYQRRPSEYRADLERYMASHQHSDPYGLKFNMQGGAGYSFMKTPHPDCPECDGMGEGKEFIKDTRFISRAASALYNGVKRTKGGGVELMIRSKDKALDLAARHTGVSKENVNIGGKLEGGGVTIYVPDNGRDPPKQE